MFNANLKSRLAIEHRRISNRRSKYVCVRRPCQLMSIAELSNHNQAHRAWIACVASVSVLFESRERGARTPKNGASKRPKPKTSLCSRNQTETLATQAKSLGNPCFSRALGSLDPILFRYMFLERLAKNDVEPWFVSLSPVLFLDCKRVLRK